MTAESTSHSATTDSTALEALTAPAVLTPTSRRLIIAHDRIVSEASFHLFQPVTQPDVSKVSN
jgi:hypothetical protein